MSREPTLRQLLDVALDAATEAGAAALRHFREGVVADVKGDGSPVTVADREAEAILRKAILHAFPTHALLGEEGGETAGDAAYGWILDPIDGTTSFVAGVPLWGVLVGVAVRGDPAVGVIHMPALGQTIAAARGEGCTMDTWPCVVSTTASLDEALVTATSPRAVRRAAPGYAALADRSKHERGWGDCYGYALVASGRAEVAVDVGVKPWDLCAVVPIIEEAGGRITDWRGERTIHGGNAVATNGLLHDAVLGFLRPQ